MGGVQRLVLPERRIGEQRPEHVQAGLGPAGEPDGGGVVDLDHG